MSRVDSQELDRRESVEGGKGSGPADENQPPASDSSWRARLYIHAPSRAAPAIWARFSARTLGGSKSVTPIRHQPGQYEARHCAACRRRPQARGLFGWQGDACQTEPSIQPQATHMRPRAVGPSRTAEHDRRARGNSTVTAFVHLLTACVAGVRRPSLSAHQFSLEQVADCDLNPCAGTFPAFSKPR